MKIAIDTSVLVAALGKPHPHHALAAPWLQRARRGEVDAVAGLHALAEGFAVLSRLPLDPPLSPDDAAELLRQVQGIRWIAPSLELYDAAIARCIQRARRSGAVYDALHLVTAEKEGAERILTFNVGDFARLRLEGGPEVFAPGNES